jgi:hypothetical protein
VFVLGIFTYTRLAQNSVEDIFYGRAINRIRHYYLELAGDRARHFMLGGNDDPLGVVRNMAVQPSRWQLHFTNAMAIGVVTRSWAEACWHSRSLLLPGPRSGSRSHCRHPPPQRRKLAARRAVRLAPMAASM